MTSSPTKINFSFTHIVILFLSLVILLYRDFLYDYRVQVTNFMGYWPYQNQILFYETGDFKYDITAPANLRFLGLITQYLIFKTIPCLELNYINIIPAVGAGVAVGGHLHPDYVCATYSNALMNYLSLCGILTLMFAYCFNKLKLNLTETIISVLLSYILINHLEAFTLDRISVLYLLTIFYFMDSKKISIILIILAALVNEKIIFILGGFFFIRYIIDGNKNFKIYFLITLLSAMINIFIFILYAKILNFGYIGSANIDSQFNTIFSEGFYRIINIFLTKSGYSNSVLPIIFCIVPYIINLKLKVTKLEFSKFDILIPLSLVIFGAGGGGENIGRYVMYSFIIWVPLLSCQIYKFLKDRYTTVN